MMMVKEKNLFLDFNSMNNSDEIFKEVSWASMREYRT